MSVDQFGTWEEAVMWLLAQPEQQELVKSCYYDQPHQAAADRYWHSDEWQTIRQYLPGQPGLALDIGAGNGISSYALAKDGWQVTALEPDPSNLVGVGAIRSIASANHLSISVTQEFGENLPFLDSNFDLVFARQVLHHAKDLTKLCSEICRVLKPGGSFIAVRDHVISSQKDLIKFFEIHPLHHLYGGENAFQLKEYTKAIQTAGLKLDEILYPFDSVINYAPYTEEELKQQFLQRAQKIPGGQVIGKLLTSKFLFKPFLSVFSKLDQRPGRLFSFVAHKPTSATKSS